MLTYLDDFFDNEGKATRKMLQGEDWDSYRDSTIQRMQGDLYLTDYEAEMATTNTKMLSDFSLGKLSWAVHLYDTLKDLEERQRQFLPLWEHPNDSMTFMMAQSALIAVQAHSRRDLMAFKPNKTTVAELSCVTDLNIKPEDVFDPHKVYYFEIPNNSFVLDFSKVTVPMHKDSVNYNQMVSVRSITLVSIADDNDNPDGWGGVVNMHDGTGFSLGQFKDDYLTTEVFNLCIALMTYYQLFDENNFEVLPTVTEEVPANRKAQRRKQQLRRKSSMFYVKKMRRNAVARLPRTHFGDHRERLQSTMSWYVGGFLRRQPYGKRGQQRYKTIWIEGHWRGHGIKLTPLQAA